MPPLFSQSACIGGNVLPSCVLRLERGVVQVRSPSRDSLMPSRTAARTTKYRTTKPTTQATSSSMAVWTMRRLSSIWKFGMAAPFLPL